MKLICKLISAIKCYFGYHEIIPLLHKGKYKCINCGKEGTFEEMGGKEVHFGN